MECKQTFEHIYDGAVTARATVLVRGCEDLPERIAGYLTKLTDEFERWFRVEIAPASEERYLLSDDRRKRWRYNPEFAEVVYSVRECEDYLLIEISAFGTLCGKKSSMRREMRFDRSSGRIVPCIMPRFTWSRDIK